MNRTVTKSFDEIFDLFVEKKLSAAVVVDHADCLHNSSMVRNRSAL